MILYSLQIIYGQACLVHFASYNMLRLDFCVKSAFAAYIRCKRRMARLKSNMYTSWTHQGNQQKTVMNHRRNVSSCRIDRLVRVLDRRQRSKWATYRCTYAHRHTHTHTIQTHNWLSRGQKLGWELSISIPTVSVYRQDILHLGLLEADNKPRWAHFWWRQIFTLSRIFLYLFT